jgi:cation transport regulator ChaC
MIQSLRAMTSCSSTRHFIFGYGSLICEQSRKITAPTLTKPAYPVTVHHLRRTWTARCKTNKTTTNHHRNEKHNTKREEEINHLIHGQTAMGIEQKDGSQTTGVLIEVDEDELAYFDKREKGYTRFEIDAMHIFDIHGDKEDYEHDVLREGHRRRRLSSLSSSSSPSSHGKDTDVTHDLKAKDIQEIKSKVWVYIPNNGVYANDKYPIMQSYLDIIIRGCLNISEDFAIKYLETTHGFDVHDQSPQYVWIDDRQDPHYVRADKDWSKTMGSVADDMLKKIHPRAVEKRQDLDVLRKSSHSSMGGSSSNHGSDVSL